MKECTLYFATVVEASGEWSTRDKKEIEPVKVEGRAPLGKQPEYCCEDIKDGIERRLVSIAGDGIRLIHWSGNSDKYIHFCPFCGAKIVLKPHLKLKEIKEPITWHQYHYELTE